MVLRSYLLGERLRREGMLLMTAIIIDRGRGPEIAGTRITVYDVLLATKPNRT
jgi:hypothetical protein